MIFVLSTIVIIIIIILFIKKSKDTDVDKIYWVTENIYISNLPASQNKKLLLKHKIKTVISISDSNYKNILYDKLGIKHHVVIAYDHEKFPLHLLYKKCYKMLEPSEGNILIHSTLGRSRSVALLLMYMMKKNNISYSQAMILLKQKYKNLKIKNIFHKQLLNFENMLKL